MDVSFRAGHLERSREARNLIHVTTNLNAHEFEDRYSNRVRSRMRELFNLIAFKRKVIKDLAVY